MEMNKLMNGTYDSLKQCVISKCANFSCITQHKTSLQC